MKPIGIGNTPLNQPKLVLVEGPDDKRLLDALLNSISLSDIQIEPYWGIDKLPNYLKTLVITEYFITSVRVLAVVRDADNNFSSSFQSVSAALSHANLPAPASIDTSSSNHLSVKVLIIPPGSSTGNLEDLCLSSVSNDPAMPCVNSYFGCLESLDNFTLPSNLSKAKAYAFISSREKPYLRVGEAAVSGYWQLNNPVFDTLRDFLRNL